jgi:hypothetical protein
MNKEALKRIFEFLEEKEEHNAPFLWKLVNNEPLTEDDLVVKGNLDLQFKKITSLPEGLEVEGNLKLFYTGIRELPEGLIVGRDLELPYLSMTSLPKGLKVYRNIYINSSKLRDFSNEELREMIKPGFIKGEIIRKW